MSSSFDAPVAASQSLSTPLKFLLSVSLVMDLTLKCVSVCVLQENSSPEEHVLHVWDHFVSKSAAKDVFIVAHNYGGLSFVELVSVSDYRSSLPLT